MYSGEIQDFSAPSASASLGQAVFTMRSDDPVASPASSHESDIEIVGEEKPWQERPPIVLSSDSEPQVAVLDKRNPPRKKGEKCKKSKKKTKKRSRSRERRSSRRREHEWRREERLSKYSRERSRHREEQYHNRQPLLYRSRSRSRDDHLYSSRREYSRDKNSPHRSSTSSGREFRSPGFTSREERFPSRSFRYRSSQSREHDRSSWSSGHSRHRDHREARSQSFSFDDEYIPAIRSVVHMVPAKRSDPVPGSQ